MDLLIATNSVNLAGADTPPVSGTPQYATDGNPGLNIPPTQWPAYWLNGLMRELMAVLTAGGVTPDRTVYNQLLTALQNLFSPGQSLSTSGYIKLPKIGGVSLILQWASYSLTPNQTTNCPTGSEWGSVAVAWPIAFPTGPLTGTAWVAPTVTVNGQYTFAAANAVTSTGCNVYHNVWIGATTPVSGTVFCIGT